LISVKWLLLSHDVFTQKSMGENNTKGRVLYRTEKVDTKIAPMMQSHTAKCKITPALTHTSHMYAISIPPPRVIDYG